MENQLSEAQLVELQAQLKTLNKKLTGDLLDDAPIYEEIKTIEKQIQLSVEDTEPTQDTSNFECVGCGS